MKDKAKKVFVGLSGGVDSSVAALLLKKEGHDVTGVFIKAWHPDFLPCNWRAEMRDAMRVCAKLEIPFLLCDLEKEYKDEVVDYLIDEYAAGHTPNPDVLCNKEIKFGAFLKFAEERGADFVATGHYASKAEVKGESAMINSKDSEKNQTYFLWTITQEKLRKILFPLGNLKKEQVRKIAKQHNLHTSSKKDSQGLCFIGHVDMKNFLRRFIDTKPGEILDESGKVIGTHEGSELYTIGERHGFTIQDNEPHYIISKDLQKNTITVSKNKNEAGLISKIILKKVNFIRETIQEKEVGFKIRYRGELFSGILSQKNNEYEISSKNPISNISAGQSVVFYIDEECLGGGIVDKTL